MSNFSNSIEAAEFIESAATRETDPRIMKAIVFHSESLDDAVSTWDDGITDWDEFSVTEFMKTATDNHTVDPADLQWGEKTLFELFGE